VFVCGVGVCMCVCGVWESMCLCGRVSGVCFSVCVYVFMFVVWACEWCVF